MPLVTSTFVPSGNTAFTSVRSKSASPQNPPTLVRPTLEVGLYPQPYIQGRSHSQPQLLQKAEPRLQSPTRAPTPPKLVSSGKDQQVMGGFQQAHYSCIIFHSVRRRAPPHAHRYPTCTVLKTQTLHRIFHLRLRCLPRPENPQSSGTRQCVA